MQGWPMAGHAVFQKIYVNTLTLKNKVPKDSIPQIPEWNVGIFSYSIIWEKNIELL